MDLFGGGALGMILPLILLVAIMYLLLVRPQKKREKQVTAMRDSVNVGDEVTTIGGIRGKIVKTKDDVLTIQVGSDRIKFDIMRWAISTINEKDDKPISKAKEEDTPKKKVAPKKMTKSSDTSDSDTKAQENDDDKEEKEETEIKKITTPKKLGKVEEKEEE